LPGCLGPAVASAIADAADNGRPLRRLGARTVVMTIGGLLGA